MFLSGFAIQLENLIAVEIEIMFSLSILPVYRMFPCHVQTAFGSLCRIVRSVSTGDNRYLVRGNTDRKNDGLLPLNHTDNYLIGRSVLMTLIFR